MLLLIGALLLVLSATSLSADEPVRAELLTTHQGLSQSIVYTSFRDHEGFLWFGTRDGLNRYDGYRFLTFRHDPFDPASLPTTSVSHITEDADGNIWIAWTYGLCKLDRHTFKFAPVALSSVADGPAGQGTVFALHGDRFGNIWVGTDRGLLRYDTRTGVFKCFRGDRDDPLRLTSDLVNSVYEDRSGSIWIGTAGQYLHRYDRARERFARFDAGVPGAADVRCVGEDSHGDICISAYGPRGGLMIAVIDAGTGATCSANLEPIARFNTSNSMVGVMCVDRFDGVWLTIISWRAPRSTSEETILYRIPLHGSGGTTIIRQSEAPWLGTRVTGMLSDRSGIIWIGMEIGVARMILEEPRFRIYRHDAVDAGSLSNNRIRAIHKDRFGTLWVGTDHGLNRLDAGSDTWTRYQYGSEAVDSFSTITVNAIFEDRDGMLLFGTSMGLTLYDRRRERFMRGNTGIPDFVAPWSFCRDSSGMLWMGTRAEGIFLYDRERRLVRRFRPRENDSTTIGQGVVWDIHCDRFGVLWFATTKGLYRWNPERNTFRRYGVYPVAPNGLSDENVCAIVEDSAGVLWFSTYGGGLNRYNRSLDSFTHIGTHDGLSSNALYGALIDRMGRLWISSNTGLTAYDPATGRSRVYNAGDGLQSNEFSFNAFHKAADGEMFFGGVDGLNAFQPDGIHDSRREVPLIITEFRAFDAIVYRELSDGDSVEIEYDQRFISFEFAALDYVNPDGIRYAYRMAGFDAGWTYCGERRYASFTNLDPGTYTFMVNGTNSDGIWNRRPFHIVLTVVPPFWMTWWFKASSVLLVVLIAAAATLLWLRSVRGREILRRRTVESQLQALRLQVNPHFIFNALSSIQHLILIRDRARAVEYLARFARLVRAILENSERTSIPIAEELENLHHYLHLESLRFEGRFRYTIEVDPAIDIDHLSIPTMLIQPYVENAIRHGLLHKEGEGSLTIEIMRSGNAIRCIIEDDGVGRRRAAELQMSNGYKGRSMGIRVTEERLRILNAALLKEDAISMEIIDLHDEAGAPRGTRIEIIIPIKSH